MAETDASVDESMEGAEQGEEYVAETETSQTEGGEEGENDENNTTYNTDVVEEEVPTQVDPDVATLEDIFGADEEEQSEVKEEQFEEREEEDEGQYGKHQVQQAIGSPLRLVTNPLPTPPEDALVVRVKLPNIIGIQSKPFTHQSLEEELNAIYEEDDDEGRRKKHANAESQIRWRYVEGTKDVKESNARIVRWSDGSMHLMLGNELLDMTMHDLNAEHLYLYARQPGFLHSQGRLNKKVVIRPASLDNKLHQKLSMSLAERNQKVSKVKLVTTTVDPEIEKAKKEKMEEEKIKRYQGEMAAKNRIMRQFGLDASYLEQTGEYYDDQPAHPQPVRRERYYNSRESRDLADFIVDDEGEDEEQEERKSRKKRRQEAEEDTERLMNAKRDLSPEPKKHRKEKEKRKVRKGGKEEEEEVKEEVKEEAEEEVKEEKTEAVEESGEATTGEEAPVDVEEEEEEVMVKKPTKARRGVIVDDDEGET